MSSWRVARSLLALRAEVNAVWPHRDHTSDGTIGDAAHASTISDHNPWVKDSNGEGVVRALDTDRDVDPQDTAESSRWMVGYAEHIRQLGLAGDARLNPNGYVIYARRIASAAYGWRWRQYNGPNPHLIECHVSVTTKQDGYDSTAPWHLDQIGRPAKPVKPTPTPAAGFVVLRAGSKGNRVKAVQRKLRVTPVDGDYGPKTTRAVLAFQRRYWPHDAAEQDGVVGPHTWQALGL